ncbi:MAG: hypothetical protein QNJ53_28835 [Pleurocapsa sp. MO_192.B19]|nr:hypothetical protein [Pleurocapsa sp. MO_192.B19]
MRQLRLILPSAWFSATRLAYLGFDCSQNQESEFLFVPMVRLTVGNAEVSDPWTTTVLTDVLGRFNLPVTFSEKQLTKAEKLRE